MNETFAEYDIIFNTRDNLAPLNESLFDLNGTTHVGGSQALQFNNSWNLNMVNSSNVLYQPTDNQSNTLEAVVIASMLSCGAENRNMYFTVTRKAMSSPVNVEEGLLAQTPTTQSNSVTLVFANYIPMMGKISGGVYNMVISIAMLFSLVAVYAF